MKKLVSFIITLILSLILAPVNKPLTQFKPKSFPLHEKSHPSIVADRSTPACQTGSLMISAGNDLATLQQMIDIIAASGGCVAHVFPPSALIGSLDPEQAAGLLADGHLSNVYREEISDVALTRLDEKSRLAALVWNEYLREPDSHDQPDGVTPGSPLTGDVRKVELPFEPILPSAVNGPGYYDTSEFLYGKVAVGIIIPESSGGVDQSTENWSESRLNQVVSEIAEGMSWYQSNFHDANLVFYYDIHRQVPTAYEPIIHSSDDDSLWIHKSFTNLGFSGSWITQAYSYLNQIRNTYQTDWAIVTFVVDSMNDPDGKFTDGYFGYTYGFLVVMTYDNDGWGISRMDSVIAHEMAHDFGAADEYCQPGYSCCWGGDTYGYLVVTTALLVSKRAVSCAQEGSAPEWIPPAAGKLASVTRMEMASTTRLIPSRHSPWQHIRPTRPQITRPLSPGLPVTSPMIYRFNRISASTTSRTSGSASMKASGNTVPLMTAPSTRQQRILLALRVCSPMGYTPCSSRRLIG